MGTNAFIPPSLQKALLSSKGAIRRPEDYGDDTEYVTLILTRFFADQYRALKYDEDHPGCLPTAVLSRGEPVDLEAMIRFVLPNASVNLASVINQLTQKQLIVSVQKKGTSFEPSCNETTLSFGAFAGVVNDISVAIRSAQAAGASDEVLCDLKTALLPILLYDQPKEVVDEIRNDRNRLNDIIDGFVYGEKES